MSIITLTSDLGNHSHYPAVMKGIIYSLAPQSIITDISHGVGNFDLMEAAFLVKNTFAAFPEGSIHVIAVDPELQGANRSLVAGYRNHYFIGPDNGVLSLVFDAEPHTCHEIVADTIELNQYPVSFRAARIWAPAAAFLSTGGRPEEMGPASTMRDLMWGEPSYAENCLRGKIIHIDKFGNTITNIRKSYFLEIRENRSFQIFLRNARIKRIVQAYSDVGKGDPVAIFGENQQLEIAIRGASAASLLGLKVHDMISIEFYS